MENKYDELYSSPYDRGGADSYYRRPFRPHYYGSKTVGDSFKVVKVEAENMTEEEIAAYRAGYNENTLAGDFKDYG